MSTKDKTRGVTLRQKVAVNSGRVQEVTLIHVPGSIESAFLLRLVDTKRGDFLRSFSVDDQASAQRAFFEATQFAEAVMPYIYVFSDTFDGKIGPFFALAEDGTLLFNHSVEDEATGLTLAASPNQFDRYAEHYPDGFVIDYVPASARSTYRPLMAAKRLHRSQNANPTVFNSRWERDGDKLVIYDDAPYLSFDSPARVERMSLQLTHNPDLATDAEREVFIEKLLNHLNAEQSEG